jgi:hypothetical protein
MSRMHRALALLALCLALASVTTAVAVAAPATTAVTEDQSDRLLRNLVAGQAEQTQAAMALARFEERNLVPVAVAAGIEDQNDRVLRSLQAHEADRTQAAMALARSVDRNLARVPAAQPSALTAPAASGASVNVLSTLLLSLIGGLVGGGAAIIGWTAASRRRPHRPAAA